MSGSDSGVASSETWCPQTKPKRPLTNPNDTQSFGFCLIVRLEYERPTSPGYRPAKWQSAHSYLSERCLSRPLGDPSTQPARFEANFHDIPRSWQRQTWPIRVPLAARFPSLRDKSMQHPSGGRSRGSEDSLQAPRGSPPNTLCSGQTASRLSSGKMVRESKRAQDLCSKKGRLSTSSGMHAPLQQAITQYRQPITLQQILRVTTFIYWEVEKSSRRQSASRPPPPLPRPDTELCTPVGRGGGCATSTRSRRTTPSPPPTHHPTTVRSLIPAAHALAHAVSDSSRVRCDSGARSGPAKCVAGGRRKRPH